MVQGTSVTKYFTRHTCLIIIHVYLCRIEGRFLKYQRLAHLQMNTAQFKYWPEVLENMVLVEQFKWVAVHKQVHHGLHGCIYLDTILQITTTVDINTGGKPLLQHGLHSNIIYSLMGRTSTYQHIILVLTIKLFNLSGGDNSIKIHRWEHQIF